MGYCANCDTHHKELLKTAYGDFLCVDCWDDYICTDAGRLEYLIGICKGDYPADISRYGVLVDQPNQNVRTEVQGLRMEWQRAPILIPCSLCGVDCSIYKVRNSFNYIDLHCNIYPSLVDFFTQGVVKV